jgi:putative thioredoxin
MSSGNNYFGGQGGYGAAQVSLGNGMTAAGGPAPAEDGLVKDTTTANFTRDVIQESRSQPVLVDFWAPWCGPCKVYSPIVEEVAKELEGKPVKIGKMNVDENAVTPQTYGIMSIPTTVIFKGGQAVETMVGVQSKEKLIEKLTALMQ